MGLLIFYLLLALVVSFFCSLLEAVLLSVTPSFIQVQINNGKSWAVQLFRFKSDIDRPLSAILSLNTISHTVGAAGVGAQAAIVFENLSVGAVSAGLTLVILIFSEIIPKTLGATYWKFFAYFTTQSLRVLNVIMYPLVLLSQLITAIFKKKDEPSVERSEIAALAEVGQKEGVFSVEEAQILKNLVSMRQIKVKDIMTPRMVMVTATENMTLSDFLRDERFVRFSRIPLTREGSKDEITGFIHKQDVMLRLSRGEDHWQLKDIAREIPVVPDNQSIYKLYRSLIKNKDHIALVVEEYGGTAGLVTMEDTLETLLGLEIVDEFDRTADLQEYARSRWRIRAEKLGIFKSRSKEN